VRTTYGKLIRDRIPEVLEAEGLRYEVVPLDGEGFRAALLAKLLEEAGVSTATRCGRCRRGGGRSAGGSRGDWSCGGRRGEAATRRRSLGDAQSES